MSKLLGKQNKDTLLKWLGLSSSPTIDNSTFHPCVYIIEEQISSPATKVIFPHNDKKICLKVWLPCNNEVYNTQDTYLCTRFLLEGLEFNRRFTKDIYLGIAPILEYNNRIIRCGQLVEKPILSDLEHETPYALIMKRLENLWRLDRQLCSGMLDNQDSMAFLATEIAKMHRQMDIAPPRMGTSGSILSKLTLNTRLFDRALSQVSCEQEYRMSSGIMKKAYNAFMDRFKLRHEKRCIKRCHGDLKATNLWILPEEKLPHGRKQTRQLLALDCVDFNDEFCHIDTLSDIAMLAIDIEMRLTHLENGVENRGRTGKKLSQYFLSTYLEEMGEQIKDVWPLLEYYMTEKSMVCAYMSILFDGLPSLGKKYLKVALVHAHNLEQLLASPGKVPSFLKKAP